MCWSVQVVERVLFLGVFVGVCGVVVKKRYLLSLLLMLEVAAFSLFARGVIGFGMEGLYEFGLVIVGVRACEAAVGLGMLINFVRAKGRDLVELGLIIKL